MSTSELTEHFRGADAVIHLAWLIQPSRDEAALEAANVTGSRRVFAAAAAAGARALVHASSVGAYSPGPSDRAVDESWPTDGTPTSFYSRHKAAAERALDEVEAAHPELRVVRLRPALIFKREAASGIRRLFAGPLLPSPLVRPSLLPVLPLPAGLRVQGVHSRDVGEAYRLAALDEGARGAYNVAAEPVLDAETLGRALGARPVSLPVGAVRAAADWSWRLRLQPTPAGWLDMGMAVPVMDAGRIRRELGWAPAHARRRRAAGADGRDARRGRDADAAARPARGRAAAGARADHRRRRPERGSGADVGREVLAGEGGAPGDEVGGRALERRSGRRRGRRRGRGR